MVATRKTISLTRWIAALGVVVLSFLLLPPPSLAAGVTITGIRVDSQGTALLLAVNLTDLLEPRVFTIDNKGPKPRVVIDFMGAKAVGLPSKLKSPNLLAKSIRVGRHSDKVRVVIDIFPDKTYLVEQYFAEGENQYLLRLSTADNP